LTPRLTPSSMLFNIEFDVTVFDVPVFDVNFSLKYVMNE